MENTQLERKQIMDTSASIDAFNKLSLSKLELLTDDELDIQFARTADLELVAWLTRAEIFRIKLERNEQAGSPKTKKQIAQELAELKNLHFNTVLLDSRIAELFNRYKVLLPKNIYELILPLPLNRQNEIIKLAEFHQGNGTYSTVEFKKKIRGMKQAESKSKTEIIHTIKMQITDRELADLNKIKRGFKNISGFGKGALGYAIRSFEAEMGRLKLRNYPDNDWVIRTIIKVVKADMANRQTKAGYESKKGDATYE